MRQFKALVLVVLVLMTHQQQARADVLGDATTLAGQLNPISLVLKGLIGEAAGALDDVLQKQLEHLRSIVDMAIRELNEVARQRIDQGDERVRAQIADLNRMVQTNLLQFNALVGKHISTIDSSMRQRINQFNFGLANDLASLKWLPTVPLLMLDGNGITTFKQSGKTTSLFISGSSFKKYDEKPMAYLSGDGIKNPSFFSRSNEIEISVPNASMGQMEIAIPNELIPDDYGPHTFSLKLKIRDGKSYGFATYNEQSVRLDLCGRLPKVTARLVVWASGREFQRTAIPLRDMLHAAQQGGNGNNADKVCLGSPPSGWEVDNVPPDFGIVFGSENHNNYGRVVKPDAGNPCLTAYADGRDGNAHQNIHDVRMKLIRVVDRPECNPRWRSELLRLSYGRLTQPDIASKMHEASTGQCDEARARAIPAPHVRVEFLDGGRVIETTPDLLEGVETLALDQSVKVKLNPGGLADITLVPQCIVRIRPAGQ